MGSMSVEEGEVEMAASMIEIARSSSFIYRAATAEALAACGEEASERGQLERDSTRGRKERKRRLTTKPSP